MVSGPSDAREVSLGRLFPWTRLFRAVGIATDSKKLILAVLGLVVLNLGWDALNRAFPRSNTITPPVWRPARPADPILPNQPVPDLASAPWLLTEPIRFVVGPFVAVFSTENDGWAFLHALLAACWAAAVWGIIGGAICRIAMLQLGPGTRTSLGDALRFSSRKLIPLVVAPLSPLLGVAIFTALAAVFGLLYLIPGRLGPVLAGLFLFLPLFAGLIMTLILVGLAAGWPLMHASVAAEAEDGFDALSRSYAYVHQRPGRYLAYLSICWLMGILGLVFVKVFAMIVVHMTEWSLSFSSAPRPLVGALFGTVSGPVDPTAASFHAWWLFLVQLLIQGWAFSYFWSSSSLIYLLLRKDVDGTAYHEVAPNAVEVSTPASGKVPISQPLDDAIATSE